MVKKSRSDIKKIPESIVADETGSYHCGVNILRNLKNRKKVAINRRVYSCWAFVAASIQLSFV